LGVILTVTDLGISFGSNNVLKSVNLEVRENEVLGVIGPNGAGKTVMLNLISGILKPTKGRIEFLGNDISKLKVTERTRMGIGRTFQIPRCFENMTVYENILTNGVFGRNVSEREAAAQVSEILDLIRLKEYHNEMAGKLGLLARKRLEIGIAVASAPKLLLLDEVAGGLTTSEVSEILEIVRVLKSRGISIVWIEHVMQTMIEGTDRVMLLAEGRDILCAPCAELMRSKQVGEVYLGAEDDE
jgi:branched-chain amino acid transport system ATP-binding protein